jgi:hypothetical protein
LVKEVGPGCANWRTRGSADAPRPRVAGINLWADGSQGGCWKTVRMPSLPRHRSARRHVVGVSAVAIALLTAITTAGCAGPGDRAAGRELDQVADSIAREAQQHWRHGSTDPVWLALWAADDSHPMTATGGHDFAVRAQPLSWKLQDGDGVLDVRITVDAAGYSAVSFADRSYPAGRATRCLRMIIGEDPDRISCRGRTVPSLPAKPVVPRLEEPQYAIIKAAMRLGSLDRAEARVRSDLPGFAIAADVIDGTWVVVVIRQVDYSCAAGVRFHPDRAGRPDVEVVVPSPRIARPGESGCSPYGILHPPQTH